MEKIEPITKRWYEYLDEGRFMAKRCAACGHIEFPPVGICNECGSADVEWVELSGEGTLLSASVDVMPRMQYLGFGPLVSGFVHLKEGPDFISWVVGVPEEERDGLFERLPLEVELVLTQHDGYRFPTFRIKEGQK